MTRYVPLVVGELLIVSLTIVQGIMSDRLAGSNVSAEQRAELLKLVPKSFGDWHGDDKPVDPDVKEVAGSVGAAVSRNYRNARTGERVDLWLIVGHARDISAHTPDVCYPGSGFVARAKENGRYPLVVGGNETWFLTNAFYKEDVTGRQLLRVFWTWFNPEAKENQGEVVWEAPEKARLYFGNTRALFKMYFTSEMRDTMETAEQSACIHFARDFLPEVEKALTAYDKPEGIDTSTANAPSAEPSTTESPNEAPGADAASEEVATAEDPSAAAPVSESAVPANSAPTLEGQGDRPLFEATPPAASDGK
jgi:hypothetical protein